MTEKAKLSMIDLCCFQCSNLCWVNVLIDWPNISWNTKNSIAVSLIVLILWSKIKLLMATHLVTMATVNNRYQMKDCFWSHSPFQGVRFKLWGAMCEVWDTSCIINYDFAVKNRKFGNGYPFVCHSNCHQLLPTEKITQQKDHHWKQYSSIMNSFDQK